MSDIRNNIYNSLGHYTMFYRFDLVDMLIKMGKYVDARDSLEEPAELFIQHFGDKNRHALEIYRYLIEIYKNLEDFKNVKIYEEKTFFQHKSIFGGLSPEFIPPPRVTKRLA